LADYAQESSHYAMLLCFLLLTMMLWVGYYYASLTGYYAQLTGYYACNLISC